LNKKQTGGGGHAIKGKEREGEGGKVKIPKKGEKRKRGEKDQ